MNLINKDIVITGCGVVSPYGIGIPPLFKGLKTGQSAISSAPPYEDSVVKKAGYFHNFKPELYNKSDKSFIKSLKRLARGTQFAIIAADQALQEVGYQNGENKGDRVGIVLSSTRTVLEKTEQFYEVLVDKGPRATSPLIFQETVNNASASHISIKYQITGPCITLTEGATSVFSGIVMATGWLKAGKVDRVLLLCAEGLTGLCQTANHHALGHAPVVPDKTDNCCPFSLERNGYILGEGAVAIILETQEHAIKHHANIQAILAGWGFAHDAYRVGRCHPNGRGLEIAMKKAIEMTNISVNEIDWIIANANGSVTGDSAESQAINRVWNLNDSPPASAIKSMLGETEGVAGGCLADWLIGYGT
ncbi:3-oxoacyl-(acyl-carrier-protein) synthase II [Beggiatoa sp. PS]|nr:3-oxoacyl-(acyl-carrier-protein) synthase II [Beggiatoa sp. PS]